MDRNFIFMGILLVLGVVAVSGCTSNESKDDRVIIQNSVFIPSTLNVTVGTTVTWINQNPDPQDIVSDARIFDSGTLVNGQSYNYTFNETGSYHYHSSIHPNMKGTIIVTAPNSTSGNGIKY
jgi:plastocyanin